MLKKLIIAGALVLLGPLAASATLPVHCEEDEARSVEILERLAAMRDAPRGMRIAVVAEMLAGAGADSYYYKDSIATLRLNVDTFTPMTFVNTVLALAKTSDAATPSITLLEDNLQNLACRRGENAGFPSIMWHSSEWILDNSYRDNLKEITENYQGTRSKLRSLDYLTRHRTEFAALADEQTYEKVKMQEFGFRNHRLPIIPRSYIGRKEIEEDLRDGDILVLVCNADGRDIYQIGFLKKGDDGEIHFIHYDPAQEKVMIEEEPLKRYFNLTQKHFGGFRWIRFLD